MDFKNDILSSETSLPYNFGNNASNTTNSKIYITLFLVFIIIIGLICLCIIYGGNLFSSITGICFSCICILLIFFTIYYIFSDNKNTDDSEILYHQNVELIHNPMDNLSFNNEPVNYVNVPQVTYDTVPQIAYNNTSHVIENNVPPVVYNNVPTTYTTPPVIHNPTPQIIHNPTPQVIHNTIPVPSVIQNTIPPVTFNVPPINYNNIKKNLSDISHNVSQVEKMMKKSIGKMKMPTSFSKAFKKMR